MRRSNKRFLDEGQKRTGIIGDEYEEPYLAFQARGEASLRKKFELYEQAIEEMKATVRELESELAVSKKIVREIVAIVDDFRNQYKGKAPTEAAMSAILLLQHVKKIATKID